MEIFYCERCGLRIDPTEIENGAAAKAGEKGYYCARCTTEAREDGDLLELAPLGPADGQPGEGLAEDEALAAAGAGPSGASVSARGSRRRRAAGTSGSAAALRSSSLRSTGRGRTAGAADVERRPGRGRGVLITGIVAGGVGFLAAIAVTGALVTSREGPGAGEGEEGGTGWETSASTTGSSAGEGAPASDSDDGTGGSSNGAASGDADGSPASPAHGGARGAAEESQRTRAARKAFEKIRALVDKGDVDDAGLVFADARETLAGTEYLGRATDLVLGARGERTIAEVLRLKRLKQYEGALQAAERAALEKFTKEHRAKLDELAEELRNKVAEIEEERRREVAELEKRSVEERRRREEARKRDEERARLARKRAEYDKLRREGGEAASRRDFDKALRLLEDARALAVSADRQAADSDDLRAQVESDILQVKADMEVTKARSLIQVGKIDEGIAAFEAGLAIKPDEDRAAELERLKKTKPFLALMSEAEALASKGDWKGAVAAIATAKGAARDAGMGREEMEKADAATAKARLNEVLAEAEGLARSGDWRDAADAAKRALKMSPRNSRARGIISRAREALRPSDERTNSIGMALVLVPAGSSMMGNEKGAGGTPGSLSEPAAPVRRTQGAADEAPVHQVRLGAYYIGLAEVTNAQFERFDPAHKRRSGSESPGDRHPVVNVSHERASAFCEWLSGLAEEKGATYRLPTEAEWERAARGVGDRVYPWGDEPPGEIGAYRCNFSMRARKGASRDGYVYAAPAAAARFRKYASPFGCLDMAGNVAEWCSDWYGKDYYKESPVRGPAGPEEGRMKVVRGGSWQSDSDGVRSANRSSMKPNTASPAVGFRVVREVDELP